MASSALITVAILSLLGYAHAITNVCPTTATCATTGGPVGIALNDPSVENYLQVGFFQGVPTPQECAQRCATENAVFYQYIANNPNELGTTMPAYGFFPRDCSCFRICPYGYEASTSTDYWQSLTPVNFVQGYVCACPNTCLQTTPPQPTIVTTCTLTGTTTRIGNTPLACYRCNSCNRDSLPYNNVRLTPSAGEPGTLNAYYEVTGAGLFVTGGASTLTIPGALLPGCCKTFTYKLSTSAPIQWFDGTAPLATASLSVTPEPDSSVVSLGCIRTGFKENNGVYNGAVMCYRCTLFNEANYTVHDVALSCYNFYPLTVSGVNYDCSTTASIGPLGTYSFSFESAIADIYMTVKSYMYP